MLAVFQRVQFAPNRAHLESMASTVARTVRAVMAECVTTSWGSVVVQLASVDTGMEDARLAGRLLTFNARKPCEVLCANFCTIFTLKIIQTMA